MGSGCSGGSEGVYKVRNFRLGMSSLWQSPKTGRLD